MRAPASGVCKPISELRARERITFLAVEQPDHIGIDVTPGTAVFELDLTFVERACVMPSVELRSEFEVSNRKIRSLAQRLSEIERDPVASTTLRQILWVALARSVGGAFGDRPTRPGDGWLNPVALQRVVAMIEGDIADDLSIARLAKVAGLGCSAFLRAFRGSTGMTPGDFVLGCRIAIAKELLETTASSILAIAGRAGFKSPSYFATTFLAREGVSPSTYRRRRALLRTTAYCPVASTEPGDGQPLVHEGAAA